MRRINLIATPRNLSTAIMYSFAQRVDTRVVDEPFYASYLQASGVEHPGRAEVLDDMENDPYIVQGSLLPDIPGKDLLFVKNMAHHMRGLPFEFWEAYDHILLIRDPAKLISSYARVMEKPTMADIGLDDQWSFYEGLRLLPHLRITVIDADILLTDPEATLRTLCSQMEIAFTESMLSWKTGGRPEDGSWAKYWYGSLHRSTGFKKQESSSKEFPPHCRPLYEASLPLYNKLFDKAIKV